MKKNIIILEDNMQIVQELHLLLRQEIKDCSLSVFGKTETAMKYLKGNSADCIIIDLKLDSDREEEWSGLCFAGQIGHMKEYDGIPVILISPKITIWKVSADISLFTFIGDFKGSTRFMTVLKRLLGEETVEKWVTLQIHGVSHNFSAGDIVCGEIYNRIFYLQTTMKRIAIPYLSMKEFILKIPGYPIYQCHRSYAVNINFIKAVNRFENLIVLEEPYGTVELGKSFKKFILQRFEKGT